jgi:hypothetical protein
MYACTKNIPKRMSKELMVVAFGEGSGEDGLDLVLGSSILTSHSGGFFFSLSIYELKGKC